MLGANRPTTVASEKATNCTNYVETIDRNANANMLNSLGEVNTVLFSDIKLSKTSLVVYDPINGTNNPKAIPLAVVKYSINLSNEGLGARDNNTEVIKDTIPKNMQMCVATVSNCAVTSLS